MLDGFGSEIGSTLDDLNLHFDDEDDLYSPQNAHRGSLQEMERFPYNKARPLNFTNPVYFLLNGHDIQAKTQKMTLIPLSQFDINQDNEKQLSRRHSKKKKESFMHSITGFMHKKKKSNAGQSEITPPIWTDGPPSTVDDANNERRSSDFVRRRESIPVDDKTIRSQSLETAEIAKPAKSPVAKIPPKKSPRLSRAIISSYSSNPDENAGKIDLVPETKEPKVHQDKMLEEAPPEDKPISPQMESKDIATFPERKISSSNSEIIEEVSMETSSMYSYILKLEENEEDSPNLPNTDDDVINETNELVEEGGNLKRNKTVKWAGTRAAPTLIREFTKKNKNRKVIPSDSGLQSPSASTPERNLSSEDIANIPETTSTEDLLAKVSLDIDVEKPKNKRETSAFTILSQCLPPAPKLLRSGSTKVRSYLHKMGSSEQYALGYAVTEFTRQTEKVHESRPLVLLHNIRSFMTDMKRYLMTNPHVGLMKRIKKMSKDINKVDIEGAVDEELDRLVLYPLYNLICSCLVRDYDKTKQLDRIKEALKIAKSKSPKELGIRDTLIPPDEAGMNEIRAQIKSLQSTFSPYYKLKHLLLAVTAIYKHTKDLNCEDESARQIGADDFLPLLVYTIVKCEFIAADIEAQYIDGLLDPVLLLGEGGYYLTTLFSAVQVINSMRRKESPLPHISDLQSFLQVGIAATDKVITPKLSSIPHHKTLHVPPSMTARSLSAMIARKYDVATPNKYFLHVVVSGSTLELKPNEFPQLVKMDLLSQFDSSSFYFVYQLKEQAETASESNEEVFEPENKDEDVQEEFIRRANNPRIEESETRQEEREEDIYAFADDVKLGKVGAKVIEAQDSIDDTPSVGNNQEDAGLTLKSREPTENENVNSNYSESLDNTLTEYDGEMTITNEEIVPESTINEGTVKNGQIAEIITEAPVVEPVVVNDRIYAESYKEELTSSKNQVAPVKNMLITTPTMERLKLEQYNADDDSMDDYYSADSEQKSEHSDTEVVKSEKPVPEPILAPFDLVFPHPNPVSPIPIEELPSPVPIMDIDALPSPPPQSIIAQSWETGLDTTNQTRPPITEGRKIKRHVSVSNKSDVSSVTFDSQKYKTMSKASDPSEQTVSNLRKYFESQANQEN